MTIGQRIKSRREELQMSQEELAHKIGYSSRSSINKIELDVQQLKQSKIKQIADALDTTPGYIMGWMDNPDLHDAKEDLLIEIYRSGSDDMQKRLLAYAIKLKELQDMESN